MGTVIRHQRLLNLLHPGQGGVGLAQDRAPLADSAIEFDPHYWGGYILRAWVLLAACRLVEAVEMMRRAFELNVVGLAVNATLALYLLFVGRRDEALVTGRELAERFPTNDNAQAIASTIAAIHELHDEAIAFGRCAVALAPHTPLMHAPLAYALARAGRQEEARDILKAIEASALPEPVAFTAPSYLALGDRATAIAKLTNPRQLGTPQFVYTPHDPRLAALKGDPEVERLWAQICGASPGNLKCLA